MDHKLESMNKPQGPVLIKAENAKKYPVDPDTDYRVADTTKHLKLRVLPSGAMNWEYDYIYRGKRKKQSLGPIGSDTSKGELSPTQARSLVNGYELKRKKGLDPFSKDAKGISLNSYQDEYFNHVKIKPHTNKEGVKFGLSQAEWDDRKSRYRRHIEDTPVGQTPLILLQNSEIRDWFDALVREKPVEAKQCLFLAKNMNKRVLKSSDQLASAIGNKFAEAIDEEEISELNERIDENREPRPITAKEGKAIWKARDESGDRIGALLVQFVMATGVRGISAMRLAKEDMEYGAGEEGGEEKYHFTVKHKKRWDTVVLTELAEKVYLEILAHHKKEGWITEYLFPSEDWTGGKFHGLRNRHMNKQDKRRIFTGRDSKGGIRGAAAAEAPTVLGVLSKTTRDKEKHGLWKIKPVGMHDIRDTFATKADNLEDATDMLQNSRTAGKRTVEKHYRQEQLSQKIKLAKKKDKIIEGLFG